MYFYPQDIIEVADVCEDAGMAKIAQSLRDVVNDALVRHGEKRATVSIDASAARGYALPAKRVADD